MLFLILSSLMYLHRIDKGVICFGCQLQLSSFITHCTRLEGYGLSDCSQFTLTTSRGTCWLMILCGITSDCWRYTYFHSAVTVVYVVDGEVRNQPRVGCCFLCYWSVHHRNTTSWWCESTMLHATIAASNKIRWPGSNTTVSNTPQ